MTLLQEFSVVAALAVCGSAAGESIRQWLQHLSYRRPSDDKAEPGRRWWVPAVLAIVFAALTWRILVAPSARMSREISDPAWGDPVVVQVIVLVTLLCVAAASVALAAVDVDVHRLPDNIIGIALLAVLAGWTLSSILNGSGWPLLRALTCGLAAGVFYLVLALASSRGGSPGLGLGDVKLSMLLGTVLGWFGFQPALIGWYAGILIGALVAVVLIVARRSRAGRYFAYGPPLMLGALTGLLLPPDSLSNLL